MAITKTVTMSGVGARSWVDVKVGALSNGGDFVISPLRQDGVVTTYL
jgi:hypothetical protein